MSFCPVERRFSWGSGLLAGWVCHSRTVAETDGDGDGDVVDDFVGDAADNLTGLDRWVADGRSAEAARRRSRERWLAQQAREEATLLGVFADLAERDASVTLHLRSGRPVAGRVRVVGHDFVAVATGERRGERGSDLLVALGQVTAVRTRPGAATASGDRSLRSRLTLAEAVIRLVAERERVVLTLVGDHHVVRGTLWSVGQDVVVVRLDDEPAPAPSVYIPLAAIAQVSLT